MPPAAPDRERVMSEQDISRAVAEAFLAVCRRHRIGPFLDERDEKVDHPKLSRLT